ncbi:predicted protein [Pyrenophora tritici-repentis Pt-1C-BFP]|uniref:Uncharacterized protein n=1 Tax=Pyrenophora tritici-repentis (strain Pt-1C-BFP) TaxID=426418 RepID=B2WDM6_PYRTR|nr:uncharacterized protein PTRG_08085 [Pyrenophora tritici-repentis Pt-1C-BFP]EDU51004.1 predicted protein [Pyrenophora tritici-repentis Pt-1C-BFP]
MAPNVDLTAQPPPARMPKLKYRNLVPTDSKAFVSLPISHRLGPHSTFSQEPPTTTDTNAQTSTIFHPSFDTTSLTSSSLASITPSRSSSNDSKSSKKKKKSSSVLGFLSLKEPSQVALEQFAEQQRKQNAAAGRTSPQSGISTNFVGQKLPPTVPKVNSKWDGVPEVFKQNRNITSSGPTKDNRNLSSRGSPSSPLKVAPWNDSGFSILTDGTRNPPNSVASASISNLNNQFGSSLSTTDLPDISYHAPEAPLASSPIQETEDQSPIRISDSTSSHRPSMDEMIDSRPHSPASSTTSADTVVMDTADAIFRKLNDRPMHGENTSNVPESHDFLFQPQPGVERRNSEPLMRSESPFAQSSIPHYSPSKNIQNFSRPMGPPPVQRFAPPYKRTPSVPTLPTLYEASMASTEDLAQDYEDDDNDDNEDSYSIAPSTIAPSELSKHWYKSPRERLGLGRRLQINDVLPWDEPKETTAPP